MSRRYGCSYVTVERAARKIHIEVDSIVKLALDGAVPSRWRGGVLCVQIPATKCKIMQMAEEALRHLEGLSCG